MDNVSFILSTETNVKAWLIKTLQRLPRRPKKTIKERKQKKKEARSNKTVQQKTTEFNTIKLFS